MPRSPGLRRGWAALPASSWPGEANCVDQNACRAAQLGDDAGACKCLCRCRGRELPPRQRPSTPATGPRAASFAMRPGRTRGAAWGERDEVMLGSHRHTPPPQLIQTVATLESKSLRGARVQGAHVLLLPPTSQGPLPARARSPTALSEPVLAGFSCSQRAAARRPHAAALATGIRSLASAATPVAPTPAETYKKFLTKLEATEKAAKLGGGKARMDKQVSIPACHPSPAARAALDPCQCRMGRADGSLLPLCRAPRWEKAAALLAGGGGGGRVLRKRPRARVWRLSWAAPKPKASLALDLLRVLGLPASIRSICAAS